MNTLCQRSYRRAGLVACLVGAFVAATARPQEAKRELLVEHVSPSILTLRATSTNSVAPMKAIDGEEATRLMEPPTRALTPADRWEKFEAEFGLGDKDPSLIKGSVESAKYRLDKTVFAANEFVQNVENALSFDYGLRAANGNGGTNTSARETSASPIPLWNVVESARLKSDIDLDVPGARAFVGIRLVLPIGD